MNRTKNIPSIFCVLLSEYIPLNILYGGCVVAVVMLTLLLLLLPSPTPFLIVCVCVCWEEEREDDILECHKDGAIFFKDSDLVEWDILCVLPLSISFFLMGCFWSLQNP